AEHLDGEGQSPALLCQGGDTLDGGDDAQHAVVAAGVAHGIQVRAEHEARQAGARAFIASGDIADRIERSTSSAAARYSRDRKTRVSPPASSEWRASESQRCMMRAAAGTAPIVA